MEKNGDGAHRKKKVAKYSKNMLILVEILSTQLVITRPVHSEKYVGEFIAGDRDRFVIATKYTSNIRAGDPNAGGNQRKNLMQSLERSLRSLNTDYIDLYWIHAWDKMTPIEETMRALDDMVKLGKVLYIGISDAPAWVVSQANTLANLRGWTEFIGIQIEYSLIRTNLGTGTFSDGKDSRHWSNCLVSIGRRGPNW